MPEYTIGMAARQALIVEDGHIGNEGLSVTAAHLVCEMACHNILVTRYGDDDASVGIRNDIWFWGDARPGDLMYADAVITEINEKRIFFNVFARVGTEEIGRGVHERMVVSRRRFLNGLP
jgi:predicted thioesterase